MLLLIIPTSLSAANLWISIHYAVQESTILLIQKNIKKEKKQYKKMKNKHFSLDQMHTGDSSTECFHSEHDWP